MSDTLLAAIARGLVGLDAMEAKRAARDLTRVDQRLRRGDYKISAFGTNLFDIPDRAAELITELEFMASIGRAWEALIRESGLDRADACVEVGSGFAPKVQLGFLYAEYRGTLFALDREAGSLKDLERYLAIFRPRYTLTPVVGSLYDTALAPCRGVVANHLFDDLLLDAYCTAESIPAQAVYDDEQVLRTAWTAIVGTFAEGAELTERIASSLTRLVVPGGVIVVTQYQSYIERLLQLDDVNRTAVRLMDAVAAKLATMGFRARPDLVTRALHGTSWVVREGDCRMLERMP